MLIHFFGDEKKPFLPSKHSIKFQLLNQDIFDLHLQPESILEIKNIAEYNQKEGLAINVKEVEYLENLSKKAKSILNLVRKGFFDLQYLCVFLYPYKKGAMPLFY